MSVWRVFCNWQTWVRYCAGSIVNYITLNGIGVLADGRCLFRAIAHGACLNNGEEAPNENRQRELADELRARVRSSC